MRSVHTSVKVFKSGLENFDYFEPETAADAVALLGRYKGKAKLLAGGTSLLVRMRREKSTPLAVINIKKIQTLDYKPKLDRNNVVLSPLTTLREVGESSLLQKKIPVLSASAATMTTPQIRNRATLGGILCDSNPSNELAPLLIVLKAKAVFMTRRKQKTIPIENFFKGPGETILGNEGILLQIQIPALDKNEKATLRKHFVTTSREFPILSVAVWIRKKRKKIEAARISLGGAGPIPLRMEEAERILRGSSGDNRTISKSAEAATRNCCPLSDLGGTSPYKMDMVHVYMIRALKGVLL